MTTALFHQFIISVVNAPPNILIYLIIFIVSISIYHCMMTFLVALQNSPQKIDHAVTGSSEAFNS